MGNGVLGIYTILPLVSLSWRFFGSNGTDAKSKLIALDDTELRLRGVKNVTFAGSILAIQTTTHTDPTANRLLHT